MPRKRKNPVLERHRINAAREMGWLIRERIQQLCAEQQMTLSQLAKKSGVSLSTIKKLVTAKECNAKFNTIAKIGWAFGIPPSQFLNEKLLPEEEQLQKDSSLRSSHDRKR